MVGTSVGRYRIIEKSGAGAFGEVFRAHDPVLGRDVALKSLPPHLAGDSDEKRRLLKEALVLGKMEHPNIAGVYDVVDDEAGRTHIVLQYVAGETLEARLKSGRLPPAEVVRLGRQIASALICAHSAGVIHRDIKPANICLTPEGSAKVLDFGLARVFSTPVTPGTTGVSRSGPASGLGPFVGTPAYMPPETLGGLPADARGDVYSLAVMLFEMLTGTRPFPAEDLPTLMPQVTVEPVPRLDERIPGLSKRLCAVVTRAMSRNPAERFQTAVELEQALAGTLTPESRVAPVATIAVVGVLALLLAQVTNRIVSPPPPTESPSVLAVFPFSLISPDSTDRYLADGMASTIAAELGMLPLSVVPPGPPGATPNTDTSLDDRMKRTGANYALAGSIEHSGARLRVSLQLFRRGRAAALWTKLLDGKVDSGFELQATAARAIEEALSHHKVLRRQTPAELRDRLGVPGTRDPNAHEAYTRARVLLDDYNLGDNLNRSIGLFQAAIGQDSTFTAAYAGLGQAYVWKHDVTQDTSWVSLADRSLQFAEQRSPHDPAVLYARAEVAGRRGRHEEARAILSLLTRLIPESDKPWAALGASYWKVADWTNAESSYREAVRRRPEYWEHHNELGRALQRQKRFEDAIAEYKWVDHYRPESPRGLANIASVYHEMGDTAIAGHYARRSVAVGPSIGAYTMLGNLAFERRRFVEAAEHFRRVTDLASSNPTVWRNLGDVQLAGGDPVGARQSYERVVELCTQQLSLNPRNLTCLRLRALCQAKNGFFDQARRDIRQALLLSPIDESLRYTDAVVETLAGNLDLALEKLGAAIKSGKSVRDIMGDPDLAGIRGLAGFGRLVEGGGTP